MGLTSAFVGIMPFTPFGSSDPSNIVWIPPGISGILEDLEKKNSFFFFQTAEVKVVVSQVGSGLSH